MSQAPIGPGYWQASDGLWYPPQGPPPVAPPQPQWAPTPTPGWTTPPPTSAPKGRKVSSRLVLVGILLIAAVGGGAYYLTKKKASTTTPPTTSTSLTAFAKESPVVIAHAALTAATRAGSVTIGVVKRSASAVGTESQVSTLNTGSQHFKRGSAVFQNRCIPGNCYIEGNAAGLESGFHVVPAAAATLSGKWIDLPATSTTAKEQATYRAVLAGTTLDTYFTKYTIPATATSTGTSSVDGQPVVTIAFTHVSKTTHANITVHMSIRTQAPHTIVKVVSTAVLGTKRASEVVRYSKWGVTPAVVAPPGSVTFATVASDFPTRG